jgi:excisionase family DNA binding protein
MRSNEVALPSWAKGILEGLPQLVDTRLAAQTAGCSEKTIYRRIREGALPKVGMSRKVRIPRLALVELMVRE